uniref:Uncharacterized protein n=1 Tax=Daphnia galeata TaxID=27404 RepID=A0A8J2WGF6_9CRUS|nr:unnamed protein product [Daphnia galeata]
MRYRRLQTAIKAVQEVERLLGEEFMAQHKSSLTTRFVIGFILILTTAIITECSWYVRGGATPRYQKIQALL